MFNLNIFICLMGTASFCAKTLLFSWDTGAKTNCML